MEIHGEGMPRFPSRNLEHILDSGQIFQLLSYVLVKSGGEQGLDDI